MEEIKRKKVSQLKQATDINGFFAFGFKEENGKKKSVKVPMAMLKGNKGEPFRFSDFTPKQLEDIKQPAVDAKKEVDAALQDLSTLKEEVSQAGKTATSAATSANEETGKGAAERAKLEALLPTLKTEVETARQQYVRLKALEDSITGQLGVTEGVVDAVYNNKSHDIARGEIGRNLVLKSNQKKESKNYQVAGYPLSEKWEKGATYTVLIKGTVEAGSFGVWMAGAGNALSQTMSLDEKTGIWSTTAACRVGNLAASISIYNTPRHTTEGKTSKIEWIKLVRSATATDKWTPAPEDLENKLSDIEKRLSSLENK